MNDVLYLLAGAAVCVFLVMASVVVAICWMAHGEPDARRDAERDGLPDQEAIILDFEDDFAWGSKKRVRPLERDGLRGLPR
jgi:hypothetical protein